MREAVYENTQAEKVLTICLLSVSLFTGCGNKDTKSSNIDGFDLGTKEEYNVDIMGVRYNLYSKGYAEIVQVLNACAALTDTVTYEGKEYSVVK